MPTEREKEEAVLSRCGMTMKEGKRRMTAQEETQKERKKHFFSNIFFACFFFAILVRTKRTQAHAFTPYCASFLLFCLLLLLLLSAEFKTRV
jgi:hypothetical protein